MSTAIAAIPPDDLTRELTLARTDELPHIRLVGDTYTITVTGEETGGRFCVVDMHVPDLHRTGMILRRLLFCWRGRWRLHFGAGKGRYGRGTR
jgi:hypothetical protein